MKRGVLIRKKSCNLAGLYCAPKNDNVQVVRGVECRPGCRGWRKISGMLWPVGIGTGFFEFYVILDRDEDTKAPDTDPGKPAPYIRMKGRYIPVM